VVSVGGGFKPPIINFDKLINHNFSLIEAKWLIDSVKISRKSILNVQKLRKEHYFSWTIANDMKTQYCASSSEDDR
jgi:hypothetical protein